MDKYILRVAIMGDQSIETSIQNMGAIDRLTVECKMADSKDMGTYNQADVIVLGEVATSDDVQMVYHNKADYAVVVFNCSMERFGILSEDDMARLFDVWITTDVKLHEYRVKQFMYRMRDYMDAELAERQLETLIDSVPDLIWYKDTVGAHIKVNESFCDTVNKTKDQIKYRGHCYIWDLDMDEYEQGEFVCMETEEVVIEEQGTFLFDEKVKIGDEMRQLKTYKSAVVGRNGETIGTVGLARDVTDIWNTHEEFKTLINNLPFPMMIITDEGEFVSANSEFDEIFVEHGSEDTFNLKEFGNKYFHRDIAMAGMLEDKTVCEMKTDGKTKIFSIEKSAIYDVFHELTGFFYIFNDITTQKEYEQKLRAISLTDELTRISNRMAVRNYFESNHALMVQNKISATIMMMDIDYFKEYNDNYGHLSGDHVLETVGQILEELNRDKDVFVARYGGEEFLLVAQNKTEDEAKKLAELIRKKLDERKIKHEHSLVSEIVTISIGVAYFSCVLAEDKVASLINRADKLLYRVKATGRNQYKFEAY